MEDKVIMAKGNYIFINYILCSIAVVVFDVLYILLLLENKFNVIELIIFSIFILFVNVIMFRILRYINKCKVVFSKDSIILSTLKIRKKTKKDIFPIFYVSNRRNKNVFIRAFKVEKIKYKDIENYGYNKEMDIHINYARGLCFIILVKDKYYYIDEFQFTKEQMHIIELELNKRIKVINNEKRNK